MRYYAKPSQLALWSRRIGLLALLIAGFGVYAARSNKLPHIQAVSVVGSALFLAVLAFMFAISSFNVIWRTGAAGLKSAYIGFFAALCLFAYPTYLALIAFSLPELYDVTTDFNDPPFIIIDGEISPYDANFASAQRQAYADIQPIILDLNLDESLSLVQEALKPMRLTLINTVKTTKNAHINALDTTLIMNLPEDVVIRLKAEAQETRIDMRSASRFGAHDFGSNAARLRKLIENIAAVSKER